MVAWWMLLVLAGGTPLAAQTGVHYRYQGNEPPGAIGSQQLLRGGPLPGYFQPVEIRAPQGALISLAVDGNFTPPAPPPRVGLLIGAVYRLRVTNIPESAGQEVYPTIEVIDRTYPPPGQAPRFPIVVELPMDDLELALEGHYITRVIYLEDPERALPSPSAGKEQNWFDAGPGVNPLEMADRMGRPMAIVRMGGRLPDLRNGPDAQFMAGSPPFVLFRDKKCLVPLPPSELLRAPAGEVVMGEPSRSEQPQRTSAPPTRTVHQRSTPPRATPLPREPAGASASARLPLPAGRTTLVDRSRPGAPERAVR